MLNSNEYTKLNSFFRDHEIVDNPVSVPSSCSEKREMTSLPTYKHVSFKLSPSFSPLSPQCSSVLGFSKTSQTTSSSLRIPSPTPLAQSGMKIVKVVPPRELAHSVPSETSSSLLTLPLPLTTSIDVTNVDGHSTVEGESRRISNGQSFYPAVARNETRMRGVIPPALSSKSYNNGLSGSSSIPLGQETYQKFHNYSLEDQLQNSKQWDMSFASLFQYKRQFGHCKVPYLWEKNNPLSQWVKRQRHQKKLKDMGRHSNLSDRRENLLNGIGFCWDHREAVWDERFQELQLFYRANGHCRVSRSNHPTLAVWLKRQRHQIRHVFSEKYDGPEKAIIAGRIEKLLELGVVLNVHHCTA
jgi:hypothetical protein